MVHASVPFRLLFAITLIEANYSVELCIVLLSVELFDEALQAGVVYVNVLVVRSYSSIEYSTGTFLANKHNIVAKFAQLDRALLFWLRHLLVYLLRH